MNAGTEFVPTPAKQRRAVDRASEEILGIRFFTGTVVEAVDRMLLGGLLVVPAAPALREMQRAPAYRDALLRADLVIPDSAFMVLIWNALLRSARRVRHLRRLSGLEYLRELLKRPEVRTPYSTLWVMAGERSSRLNLQWLYRKGVDVPAGHVYMAPMYAAGEGDLLEDPALAEMVERLRPDHIIVTLGGGTQERLGLYLRDRLTYRPGIHCIGAAIAFLSGDQVSVPVWADRFYLGWLLRVLDNPRRYGPRYWAARDLLTMMLRYRERLPPLLLPAK